MNVNLKERGALHNTQYLREHSDFLDHMQPW
jgi:hypothetical protein